MSSASSHKTALDFSCKKTAFSLSSGYHDSMITNADLLIGREAFIPAVPFVDPWMFLDYFTLLPIWCQLMHILIFT